MQKLLPMLVCAIWVVAIAIIAVQNATPVAINFLGLQSVPLPFGVVLSFYAAGGMLLTGVLLTFLGRRRSAKR